ncbi:hypothetical protein SLS56_005604 [Neofusicoccum ribis]|uniref:Heterokaryon incompatibility domain-containing protein n=1 Tax=Neofusicoccum ribis TaxID=45134 RepID=A0ABR3STW6_9PEZI
MCGFEVKRSTGTTTNFSGLIDWEDIRTKLDSIQPLEPWLSHPSGFRVIDVEQNNVVLAPPPCEYVTLSYVWGAEALDKPFYASLSNICSLEKPQGLLSGHIPATVQDAMKACAGLGKGYLWVDRFCILQDEDDNPSKKDQINAMGDIYRHAFATLVALEGDGADHGLFGVSNLKRELLCHFHIGNQLFREVAPHLDFNETVRESVWNSRGWTLQEAVLSNKLIFFTQHGVICEYGPNESIREEHLGFRSTSAKSLFWPEANSFDSLKDSLRQITERKFGKEDDILNAFSGVLKDRYGDHRFGLPLQGFEEALL